MRWDFISSPDAQETKLFSFCLIRKTCLIKDKMTKVKICKYLKHFSTVFDEEILLEHSYLGNLTHSLLSSLFCCPNNSRVSLIYNFSMCLLSWSCIRTCYDKSSWTSVSLYTYQYGHNIRNVFVQMNRYTLGKIVLKICLTLTPYKINILCISISKTF